MSLPRDRKRHGQRVGIRVGGYCYYSSLTVGTRPTPPLFTRSRWTLGAEDMKRCDMNPILGYDLIGWAMFDLNG